MGQADYLAQGDWNAVCAECGRKAKASTLKKHWQGYWVCTKHWEERHPQDFVYGIPDKQTPPWTQPPPADVFIPSCTFQGRTAIVGYAMPGCSIPGNSYVNFY